MMASCPEAICSHSISTRLSRKLAVFTMLVLGVLFALTWGMVKSMLMERNAQDLSARCNLVEKVVAVAAREGGEPAIVERLTANVGAALQHVKPAAEQSRSADPWAILLRYVSDRIAPVLSPFRPPA